MTIIWILALGLCGHADNSKGEQATFAAVQLIAIAAFESKSLPSVPKDQIRGECTYKETACPGAQLLLKDSHGKILDTQILAQAREFTFTGLRQSEYHLELQYPRYKLMSRSYLVKAGQSLRIELTSP